MVVPGRDKVRQCLAPEAVEDIFDNQVLNHFFSPGNNQAAEFFRSFSDESPKNCGPGKGLAPVTKVDYSQDMQGVGRGESCFDN